MKKQGPIGVFDSGYGGLTILKELRQRLPQYDYLYLGDNARAPYGSRSFDVVYEYTKQAVEELFSRGCSLVIVACNTASAKALRTIQQHDLPKWDSEKRVLGVIRPSTEEIGSYSQSGHVGIVATEGTVRSNSYELELAKSFPELIVTQKACPMWVPLIENDEYMNDGAKYFIQRDIQDLLSSDGKIDTILLGCTHYPIIESLIKSAVPSSINVVSQGPLVAQKLELYLQRHPEMETRCSKGGEVTCLTTERASTFDSKAKRFFGEPTKSVQIRL
jgi:glutamate racemase